MIIKFSRDYTEIIRPKYFFLNEEYVCNYQHVVRRSSPEMFYWQPLISFKLIKKKKLKLSYNTLDVVLVF